MATDRLEAIHPFESAELDVNSATREAREAAFRELFELNYKRLLRFTEGQFPDAASAEDVVSDVFHIAWQKLDMSAPFTFPWFVRTALNRTRDARRSAERSAAALATLGEAAGVPGSLSDVERMALYEALAKLPPGDRLILELTYWGELTASEVAQVLKVREGAVWTRVHRARAKLRELLDPPTKTGVDNE